MPRLTRLQELPHDRVALELDGRPWRVVPGSAVVRAGLREGVELDRERLRAFRLELRRAEAIGIAVGVLARRDAARAELVTRLERRGVAPVVRDGALAELAEVGVVDDRRFAAERAQLLAARGYGDEAVRFDLEQRGVAAESIEAACADLAPEAERVADILERRGHGSKTATFLSRRGFGEDAVERALID